MNHIFLLSHIYEYNHPDGYEELEDKSLGVYLTKQKAEEAAKRYYKLPGFNKYPFDCFLIEEMEIDKDYGWSEGFVNWEGKYFGDIQDW